jgi:hypothetical protein
MPLASNEEPSTPQGHMTAQDALELYALFEKNGIAVCVDGGWGVDALIGRQTRLHADLDIAIEHRDVPRVRELLEMRATRTLRVPIRETATSSWATPAGVRLISTRTRLIHEVISCMESRIHPTHSRELARSMANLFDVFLLNGSSSFARITCQTREM